MSKYGSGSTTANGATETQTTWFLYNATLAALGLSTYTQCVCWLLQQLKHNSLRKYLILLIRSEADLRQEQKAQAHTPNYITYLQHGKASKGRLLIWNTYLMKLHTSWCCRQQLHATNCLYTDTDINMYIFACCYICNKVRLRVLIKLPLCKYMYVYVHQSVHATTNFKHF